MDISIDLTLSDFIALLAIVLSLLSLGWQVWARVLDGPRVKVSIGSYITLGAIDHLPDGRLITVRNVGRTAAVIDHVSIDVGQGDKHASLAMIPGTDGPGLPHRLEPGHMAQWQVPIPSLQMIAKDYPRHDRWRARVSLGSGKRVYSSRGFGVD